MPEVSKESKQGGGGISFSIFNSAHHLVKTITVEDGKLVKAAPSSNINSSKRCTAPDLKTVMDNLDKLDPYKAVGWGVHTGDKDLVFVVTADKKAKGFAPADAVTRTKDNFAWPNGAGVLCFDIDEPHTPEQAYADIRAAATTMFGSDILRDVEMFYRPSTSAGCYVKKDGRVEQAHGARIYMAVSKAKNIVTLGKAIYDGLWINGKGRVVPSKAGTPLYRTLVDPAVWSAERIDYVGAALRGDGVGYEPPDRKHWGIPGTMADLSDEQIAATSLRTSTASNARDSALKAAKDKLKRVRDSWVAGRLKETERDLVSQGLPPADITAHLESLKSTLENASASYVLGPKFVLYLNADHTQEVSIGMIMKEPDKYNGMRCCDPLEPEGTYGKARIYTKGRVQVRSFLHGGAVYHCASAARYPVEPFEEGDKIAVVEAISYAIDKGLPSQVFINLGEPVRISSDGRLAPLCKKSLPLFLDKGVQFHKWKSAGADANGNTIWEQVPTSLNVVPAEDYIMACSDPVTFGIVQQEIRQVINRPMWMPETESVLYELGYDPTSKLFLSTDEEFPEIPVINSVEDAFKLVQALIAPYQDFPIHNPDNAPNFKEAMILTMCLSAAIRPTVVTPAIMVDANSAGVGKTELCKSIIAGIGERMSSVRWGHDETEAAKTFVAWARTHKSYLVIENHDKMFKSECIESVIDKRPDEVVGIRILGFSENFPVCNNFLMLLNGINIRPGGAAMARRTLKIILESSGDAAWGDKKFQFKGNPVEYILANWRARHMMCLALVKWGASQGLSTSSRFNALPDFDKHIRQLVHRIFAVDVLSTITEEVTDAVAANGPGSPKGLAMYHAYKMLQGRNLDPMKAGWFTVADLKKYLTVGGYDQKGVLATVLQGTKALAAAGEINGMRWLPVPDKTVNGSKAWVISGSPSEEPTVPTSESMERRLQGQTGQKGGAAC